MTRRLVAWRGIDPDRYDAATVDLEPDRLRAWGSSVTAGRTTTYRLVTGADWVTERLEVTVDGPDARGRLALRRDDTGRWWTARSDDPDGPSAPEVAAPELDGALDCDLGLCPLTNTMPVRRRDLVAAAHRGDHERHTFVMAWVDLPTLRVHRSEQTYAARYPSGAGALVDFRSGDYATTLEVDADGLVLHYPDLAHGLPSGT